MVVIWPTGVEISTMGAFRGLIAAFGAATYLVLNILTAWIWTEIHLALLPRPPWYPGSFAGKC